MAEQLRLDDAALFVAGRWLLTAAETTARAAEAPQFSQQLSLPGAASAASEVTEFLHQLMVARLSLTDSARTACDVVVDLMRNSDALDKELGAAMSRGYAVHRGG